MATDMNHIIVIGRLVRDVELRSTASGTQIGGFSLAVRYTYKQDDGSRKEETSFFNCTAFGKTAENLAQYVKKGHRVGIEGRLKQETWETSEGKKQSAVKIMVERFHFLQPKNADAGTQSAPQSEAPQGEPSAEWPEDDGTIPF
jgi:single-strand DNA-binding protein